MNHFDILKLEVQSDGVAGLNYQAEQLHACNWACGNNGQSSFKHYSI